MVPDARGIAFDYALFLWMVLVLVPLDRPDMGVLLSIDNRRSRAGLYGAQAQANGRTRHTVRHRIDQSDQGPRWRRVPAPAAALTSTVAPSIMAALLAEGDTHD